MCMSGVKPSTFKNDSDDSAFVACLPTGPMRMRCSRGLSDTTVRDLSGASGRGSHISLGRGQCSSERVIASLRQKIAALEMELSEREATQGSRLSEVELQEALRVSESRVSQLQRGLENERARRKALEDSGGEERLAELREENASLLKSEEELMVMVLEMEGRIDRLVDALRKSE